MNERKEDQQQDPQVRPLARVLARELSAEEVALVTGAYYCSNTPSGKCLPPGVTDEQL